MARMEAFDFDGNFLFKDAEFGQQSSIFRWSPDTLMKAVVANEAFEPHTMAVVSSQTNIPVPNVRRYIHWSSSLWIFMEFIPGEDLKDIWESLSTLNKLWVAWTLRGYVAQLRAVHLASRDLPGPIDGSGSALRCIGHYFTEMGAGPFASYQEMSSWFDRKYRLTLQLEQLFPHITQEHSEKPYSFDSSMPLVLTHGDISINNIRLGPDGTLWLMDWERAGAYPEWFEYSCILAYQSDRKTPRSWLRLAPLITGAQKSKHAFLLRIIPALDNFGFGEE